MQFETIVDDATLDIALGKLEGALSGASLSSFFRTGGAELLQERAFNRFVAEGDDASGDWDELRPATWSFRESGGYPPRAPINVREGDMFSWLQEDRGHHVASGNTAQMVWPGDGGAMEERFTTAQIGSNDPRTVPRPVVAASQVDLRLLLSGVADFIADAADLEIS